MSNQGERETFWRRMRRGYDRLSFQSLRCESESNRTLTVQGCCAILEYTYECIVLQTRDPNVGAVCVCGRELLCLSYHPDAVRIRGEISSVSFCKDGGKWREN